MQILLAIGAVVLVIALICAIMAGTRGRRQPIAIAALVCGATGVGKSTLINVLAGREAARTGIGAPVTQNTTRIDVPERNLIFYDSKGLEVEEASQTYLMLLSDILNLRYGADPRAHIDLVIMCIQEPQGRIDEAHREIAALCDDLRLPLAIVVTKTSGDTELEQAIRREFKSAIFIRRVRSLEMKLAGLTTPIPVEGLDDLLADVHRTVKKDFGAARSRSTSSFKTASLARSARVLAQSGGRSDQAWIGFASAASTLLDIKPNEWSVSVVGLRDQVRRHMVPGFIQRVLLTKFDNTRIDGACSRRIVPLIVKKFAANGKSLSASDLAQAKVEACSLLESDRPYRSRF